VVLCYHGISATWPDATAVSPEHFQAQVEAFLRRGYLPVTFSRATADRAGGPTFAVTFDDAATSVGRFAAPILRELGVPGTVFVPTDFPDSGRPMSWSGIDRWLGGPHEGELESMGWDELSELHASGWEIGSHTCSHPRLETVDDATLARELSESKRICEERLGAPCSTFAYPYGFTDERVERAVGEAGYELAATVPTTAAACAPLAWPRVGVYRGDGARRIRLRVEKRALIMRLRG
jgi:peptidoglycan/xylan/chitin deacetylase (PgdA/CDA1 family)